MNDVAHPATGSIEVKQGRVIWTFSAAEADAIAEIIEAHLSTFDMAHQDAAALHDAADVARRRSEVRR